MQRYESMLSHESLFENSVWPVFKPRLYPNFISLTLPKYN